MTIKSFDRDFLMRDGKGSQDRWEEATPTMNAVTLMLRQVRL
jgi:hypothetical protein